jgi:trk system potassium uptake protein TrkA
MRIMIVGDGKVGLALTEQLSREGHDVTVIDSNPKVLEQSLETFDVMVVHGNGAAIATLQEAGAPEAHLIIAATSSDEINLLSCIVARKLGTQHTIARVRNPEYTDQLLLMREELGLSMTINPELAAAQEAYHLLQFPSFLKRDSFAKGRVEIVELCVDEGARLDGIPLSELYRIVKVKVLVCAVERGGQVYIPDGHFTLQAGDNIYVTADSQHLATLIKNLGLTTQKVRSIIIVGGSRIAYYLAQKCLKSGIDVKIIEQNHDRCRQLAELLPQATIIESDGSRQDILAAEGIQNADALITLTNIDEENLIISMYANHLGVPKVITKINRTEYIEVFRNMGVNCVVSPKALCSADIVRYVRAMDNAAGSSVITLHRIADDQAEALEFCADETTRYLGRPLSEIPTRSDVLIACITHNGKPIIPSGSDSFQAGDTVIVVTTAESTICVLNDIFAG